MSVENIIKKIEADAEAECKVIRDKASQEITKIQEAYVSKVIDTVNDLDNVLYEIVNESGKYSTEWQYHLINFIHEYEKGKPKQHPVGMTFQFNRDENQKGSNKALFDSPADWISPNPEGGYTDNPPIADGSKVILTDTDHLWGIGGNQAWVWKSFCRGLNPLFMDPYLEVKGEGRSVAFTEYMSSDLALDPKWETIRRNLGYTLSYAKRMNLAKAVPMNDLVSTRYCLANLGVEYLAYLPDGGKVAVDLSDASGELNVEWFDPGNGIVADKGKVIGGKKQTLEAPFDGDAVVYIYK